MRSRREVPWLTLGAAILATFGWVSGIAAPGVSAEESNTGVDSKIQPVDMAEGSIPGLDAALVRIVNKDGTSVGCGGPSPVAVRESLGGVRQGAGRTEVWNLLGGDADIGHPEDYRYGDDPDARWQRVWEYGKKGVRVRFSSMRKRGPWTVSSIIVAPPVSQTLTTAKGVGIGASLEQVIESYRGATIEIERKDDSGQAQRMTVQSGEDYLEFQFDEQGTVTRIYLGPMP